MAQHKIEIRGHLLLGSSLMVHLGHHVSRTRYGITLPWERNANGKVILGLSVSGSKLQNNLRTAKRRQEELRGRKVLLLTGTDDVLANSRYKWLYLKYNNLVQFLLSIDCELVLMTVPPIRVLPKEDGRNDLLLKFNQLVRHIAENKSLCLIDIFTLFTDGPIKEMMFEEFCHSGIIDQLHWNNQGMEEVVRKIETEL